MWRLYVQQKEVASKLKTMDSFTATCQIPQLLCYEFFAFKCLASFTLRNKGFGRLKGARVSDREV